MRAVIMIGIAFYALIEGLPQDRIFSGAVVWGVMFLYALVLDIYEVIR